MTDATVGDRIDTWLATHSPAAKLARFVSLAAMVEPELLRAARLTFCRGLGVEAEHEIWFSPLVESRAPSGIIFRASALERLWADFPERGLLPQVYALTRKYRQGVPPAIEAEEELRYWALSGHPDAPERIESTLASLIASMLKPEFAHLAVWAERALPRLPGSVRRGEKWAVLQQAAWERGARITQVDPQAPAWLKPAVTEGPLGVRLFGRSIEFTDPPATEALKISAPGIRPLRVLVSPDVTFATAEEVLVRRDAAAILNVDVSRELYVRPAGGRTWAISALHDPAGRPRVLLGAYGDRTAAVAAYIEKSLGERGFDISRSDAADRGALVLVVADPDTDVKRATDSERFRADCHPVVLICPPGAPPSWPAGAVGHTVVDFAEEKDWARATSELAAVLSLPTTRHGHLQRVPPLPPTYIPNPPVLAQLHSLLSAPARDAFVAAMSGLVGSGRRTAVSDVVRRCEVRRQFPEGIVWLDAPPVNLDTTSGRLLVCDYAVDAGAVAEWSERGAHVVVLRTDEPSDTPRDVDRVPFLRIQMQELDGASALQLCQRLRLDEATARWVVHKAEGSPLAIRALASLILRTGLEAVQAAAASLEASPRQWPERSFGVASELRSAWRGAAEDQVLALAPGAWVPHSLWGALLHGQSDETLNLLEALGVIELNVDRALRVREAAAAFLATSIAESAHARVVDIYRERTDGDWALGPADGYYHRALLGHLYGASQTDEAEALLLDYDWVLAVVTHLGEAALLQQLKEIRRGQEASGVLRSNWPAAPPGPASPARAALKALLTDREGSASVSRASQAGAEDFARALSMATFPGVPDRLRERATARLKMKTGEPAAWVLVAGYGGPHVGLPLVYGSEVLGRELARAGFGLLSGGWPGVDHMVCREFVRQVERDDAPVDRLLVHVIPGGSTPDLWAVQEMYAKGRLDDDGSPVDAARRSVERADAVVLVGGADGTRKILDYARRKQKPVFGVPGTGGVADELWTDSRAFRASQPRGVEHVGPREHQGPLTSHRDARPVLRDLMDAVWTAVRERRLHQRM